MSEVETFHDSQAERDSGEEEVIFREDNPRVENSAPPNMITANDLDVVIEGWERNSNTSPSVCGRYNWPLKRPILT